ncbi:MAG: hypothetical protein OQK00_05755 [Rhodobacteraceae bacterium]|nr:hypothetical protein [Paracoccaceae bacterium]
MEQRGMGPFHAANPQIQRSDIGHLRPQERAERQRLEEEAGKRFATLAPVSERAPEKLSRIDRVMRRNAPDLAGGTAEEIAAARARRRAHHYAKRPRPRLVALVVLITSGLLNPLLTLKLLVWAVVLFLVLSVAAGPERARDYSKELWRGFVGLWKHEIVLTGKALKPLRERIELWRRTAL